MHAVAWRRARYGDRSGRERARGGRRPAAAVPEFNPKPADGAQSSGEFRALDADVQDLKKQVLDLNKDLFLLEEELLFPSNTQVAVFVSMDVGDFFGLDSVELKIDNKNVTNYLYTEREASALVKGGVQRVFVGNLKAGQHELVAVFTGEGPHTRDYRRGASLKFEKGIGPKYIELTISDRESQDAAGVRRQGVGVVGAAAPDHSCGGRRGSGARRSRRSSSQGRGSSSSRISRTARCCSTFSRKTTSTRSRACSRPSSVTRSRIISAEAEVMLGGLYLSYGEHRLAGEIFERVLAKSVDPALNDRCWFFLAKIWHQRGYQPEAEAALGRITGKLPDDLEPAAADAHGRGADGRKAASRTRSPCSRPGRSPATRGSATPSTTSASRSCGLGKTEDGARVLDEVGKLEPKTPQLAALRDKANVALGYAWLQASRPVEAKPSLERVRLEGPFSNKALLGVGWSDAESKNYRGALAPWLALNDRDLLDSAVQESLLAVPYAYAQLGADKQAADRYVEAIDAFAAEINRLTTSIDAIEHGDLITELLGEHPEAADDASGWYWRLDKVPDTVESRYLYELMASNKFQEALKNYRDLLYLSRNLEHWQQSLGAFDDILDTRQRAYEQRLPAIDESLGERRPRRDDEPSRRVRVALAADRAHRGRRRARHGRPAEGLAQAERDGGRACAAAERRRIRTSSAKSSTS